MTFEQPHSHLGVVGDWTDDGDFEEHEEDHDQDMSMAITRTVETLSECIFDRYQTTPFVLENFVSLFDELFISEQFSTPNHHTMNIIK